ncbi:MAG: SRPBCC family protein [Pirellulaceae bacterium]|nr:SRPBCC family protein [Pirellulaceae bacterium]
MPQLLVQRSIQIQASCDKVFDAVADFGTWTTWSPWLGADPQARVEVRGDGSSVGAVYSWQGDLVGQGEIEHQRLEPGRRIEDQLRFIKPFKSQSQVTFELATEGGGTRLTWQMRGSLPWFLFWMSRQMETLIGMDYDRGLKMLKEWLETGQILSRTDVQGVQPVGPLTMAGVRTTCALSEIGPSMDVAFSEARRRLAEQGLPTDGQPMSVYHKLDFKTGAFDYTSGLSLPAGTSAPAGLSAWSIPQVRALRVEHIGSYNHLGNAWSIANQVARYKKLKQSRVGAFEVYQNDPHDTPPVDLRTMIYLPLRG